MTRRSQRSPLTLFNTPSSQRDRGPLLAAPAGRGLRARSARMRAEAYSAGPGGPGGGGGGGWVGLEGVDGGEVHVLVTAVQVSATQRGARGEGQRGGYRATRRGSRGVPLPCPPRV